MSKPKFLVLGGGFAGIKLAHALSPLADVTVIDRKEYFEINYAAVRAAVQPGFEEKILIPYKAIPRIGQFLAGSVASMTQEHVTLASGEVIGFDYAAICTGSTYSDAVGKGTATAVTKRLQEFKDHQMRIREAQSIVIVGGGPVGVEIAGEILTEYPDKKVTIVHGGDRLLNYCFEGTSRYAGKWLEDHGAQVLLNEHVSIGEHGLLTRSGRTLKGDVTLWCTGVTPNTGFLKNGELAHTLDADGFIKVDDHLCVTGVGNMWAVGDCSNASKTKMGYLAKLQARHAADNIKAVLQRGKQAPWPRPTHNNMAISMGSKYGIMQMMSFSVPGWIPTTIKSKDLYVRKIKKELLVTL